MQSDKCLYISILWRISNRFSLFPIKGLFGRKWWWFDPENAFSLRIVKLHRATRAIYRKFHGSFPSIIPKSFKSKSIAIYDASYMGEHSDFYDSILGGSVIGTEEGCLRSISSRLRYADSNSRHQDSPPFALTSFYFLRVLSSASSSSRVSRVASRSRSISLLWLLLRSLEKQSTYTHQ